MIPHTDTSIRKPMSIEHEIWQGCTLLPTPWFCGEVCEESYADDRDLGLIYGSVLMIFESGNERIVGYHDAMRWTHRCPYCGADKPEQKR